MKSKVAPHLSLTVFCALCLGVLLCGGVLPSVGGALSPTVERAYAAPAELEAADSPEDALSAQKASGTSAQASAVAKPTKAQIKKFKKATANFSIELLAQSVAAKGIGANVTVSPYSVMNALAMTTNGAAGKTSAELRRVLAGGVSKAVLNKTLYWYNSKLVNSSKARIRNANALWYHNDGTLKMKKKFLQACKKYYGAAVNAADFSDPATVQSINGWVANVTNNMIKQVVSELYPDERIALLNALYFDAKWKVPFEKDAVTKGTFTTAKGKRKKVNMMHGTENTYIEAAGVTGFIKPYAKGYSYVALLPDEGVSLKSFVSSLTGDKFRSLISHAKKQRVRITMPKHTLNYTNEALQEQLIAMGVKTAFTGSANLSQMATDSTGNLSLGRVVHKTKVKVDESGTKAAAVTAIVARNTSAEPFDMKVVTLDRPFVYAIIDNTAKLPVFIGTVNTIGK